MTTTSCESDSRDGASRPPGPPSKHPRALSRTEAFKAFQRSIGDATLHLNTVAVGLEVISLDPSAAQAAAAALNVGWRPPSVASKKSVTLPAAEPLAKRVVLPTGMKALRDLTSRSKIFVLRAVLVTAFDALDTFVTEIARTEWLKFDLGVIDICTKAVTKPGKIAWTLSERYFTICQALGIRELNGHCALLGLGSRWRNALVHAENAEFALEKEDRKLLIDHADQLNKAGFKVGQALDRFDHGLNPTLKDVTTIISYAQDLCRVIDLKAIQVVASQESEVEALLHDRLRAYFKSRGRVDAFWGIHRDHEWDLTLNAKLKNPDRVARSESYIAKWESRFESMLDALGFSSTKHPASAPVSFKEIGRLRSMSASEFAQELGLPVA